MGDNLLWISRRNHGVNSETVPRPEARNIVVAGKRGEQSVSSQQHVIENRAARRRTAIRKLVDEWPREAELVLMCGLNSRPGSHCKRRRQTGSPNERCRAAHKHIRRADSQACSSGAHRDVWYAPSRSRGRSFGAGHDWQRARSSESLPERWIFKHTCSAAARLPSGLEVIREIGVGEKIRAANGDHIGRGCGVRSIRRPGKRHAIRRSFRGARGSVVAGGSKGSNSLQRGFAENLIVDQHCPVDEGEEFTFTK